MDINKENLSTIKKIINSKNEQSQEIDTRKNNRLNMINERPQCRNGSNSVASESTKFARKSENSSKHLNKDPLSLNFSKYTQATVIKQNQHAQRSDEMYGKNLDGQLRKYTLNPLAQSSTCLSQYLSDPSHHHQSPARSTQSIVLNVRDPTPLREKKQRKFQNVNSEKPMERNIIRVDPPISQQQKLRQNTISAVRNTSGASNQSSCSWNGSSRRHIPQLTQDQSMSKQCNPERRNGKPPKLNHMEKSINSTKITEHKSSFVQSTPNTNQPIKTKLLQAYDQYNQKQCLPILEDYLDQEMPTVKMTIKNIIKYNHFEPITCPENNTEQESNINPNLFDSIHTLSEIKFIVKKTILKVFQNVEEQMQLAFNEEFLAHSDNNKKKDDCKENNSNYKPPKKKRLVPPEYDPHNSRWTLKHQGIRPGVVELLSNSNTYVSERQLADCKRVAKGYRTFGRMLLVEIFSQNALSVCSLTSAKTSVSNNEADIRPGLDKKAISTLLTYVENYGRGQAWGVFRSDSVVNSLKSKIYDIRSKYGSLF